MRRRVWIPAALLVAGGCGGNAERAPETETGAQETGARDEEPRTFVYECPEGPRLVVRIEAGQQPPAAEAVVFAPGETLFLPHVESASGVRYSDGESTYWSKGDEASFELGGRSWTGCRNDPEDAVWEAAKLDGADFRAVGNDPGWVLVMFSDRWTFATDDDAVRFEVPAVPPTGDPEAYRTVWLTEVDGRPLRIVVRAGPCRDTRADDSYGSSVTVDLDGVTYEGCGRALH